MSSIDDNIWLRQLSKGDEYAYRVLFDRYYDVLNNFACKYVDDIAVSEDIVQDVFYNLWEKRESHSDINSLKSYLYSSVKNKCLNHLQHNKVKEKYLNSEKKKQSDEFFLNQILEEEVYQILRDAIKTLPEQTKDVYELSLLGYSNPEIAERLDLSIDSVKSHKKRGKKFLKERLQNLVWLLALIS